MPHQKIDQRPALRRGHPDDVVNERGTHEEVLAASFGMHLDDRMNGFALHLPFNLVAHDLDVVLVVVGDRELGVQ